MQVGDLEIGLALGAGGARGLAHLGVLDRLRKEELKIDYIAGTSIGSLIGGVYATGARLKYLKGLAREIDWDSITDVTFPRLGLIKGKKLLSFLEVITKKKHFSDLDIPFAAVSCDVETGEHVVINEGSVARAIRASTSIPGVYVPFKHQGHRLVDGAILDPVPISTVKEMGADVVMAVDLGLEPVESKVSNIIDVLINTFNIMQTKYDNLRNSNADIIIKPELNGISTFDLKEANQAIEAGYRAADNSMEKIKMFFQEEI
ncbi:MAG: patatin-like phospholipase family protein [Halanaerobiales bacterium]